MKLNSAASTVLTHEGGASNRLTPYQQLRRTVMNCLLWEDNFYEDGESVADRLTDLVNRVSPEQVIELAKEARHKYYLRHVPLFLLNELSKRPGPKPYLEDAVADIISRPDELTEFLAIYWKQDKHPIAASLKRGLARGFSKFNEYQLSKWNKDHNIKLRDVMRLCHPKPADNEQAQLWKRLIMNELATADTWEVALSAGKDKKETFERLLIEKKLGGLAVLRNLRNMRTAQVNEQLVRERLEDGISKVFPYRFITASKYWPTLEDALEKAMFKALEDMPAIAGSTGLLVDVSGSMDYRLSSKSESDRIDAANGLAILLREKCQDQVKIATFSKEAVEVAPRRGFALAEAIKSSQEHSSTYLSKSLYTCFSEYGWSKLSRIIIITDEQSNSREGLVSLRAGQTGYIINVAAYQQGVKHTSQWLHIDGWSERSIDYIREIESKEYL